MWYVWGEGKYIESVGKLEEKRPLGRPRHRREYDIEVNLK
jgi:hypothetical protein